MHQRATLVSNACNLCNRLNGPYLVVCVHDRNQHSRRAHCTPNIVRINNAVAPHLDEGDFIPLALKGERTVENGVVLKLCCYQMTRLVESLA